MPYYEFIWTDEIVEHLAEHGVSPEEFEQVVRHPDVWLWSRSSGRPGAQGYTTEGRYLMVVYEHYDQLTILPVTAYDIPEP